MLTLARRIGQHLVIGNVLVYVVDVRGGKVRLGVDAPKEVRVRKSEFNDKGRKAMGSEQVQIGKLIDKNGRPDAVHVAIAPVVAIEDLEPGQRIGFASESRERVAHNGVVKLIGIVDPFLSVDVKRGDRFFMFLDPNTITSLRHEWTHPDFVPTNAQGELARYAREQGVDYERLMDIMDCGSRGNDEQVESTLPGYIWDYWERVTGETADENRRTEYMGCAC